MRSIAVITGASSGMGRKFVELLHEYGEFDEVWAIARRKERLNELQDFCAYPIRSIALDLSTEEGLSAYHAQIEEEKPRVKLLINCSGYGKFGATTEIAQYDNLNMIDLNCRAVVSLCQSTLPYMTEGSKIINVASVAAFQPVPYIGVYAATKSFVLSFSRSLNRELKGRRISVTAVCPFWTRTEFFDRAVEEDKEKVVKKYVAMYEPEQIVRRAFKDTKKGKDVSEFGFIARLQVFLAKILPHSFVMSYWQNQQKLK